MDIDEMQERFNEMRRKKWRKKGTTNRVSISGFVEQDDGKCFILVACDRTVIFIDPLDLKRPDGDDPYIEEVRPYADWPIDAKVYFWDENSPCKVRGFFAGVSDSGKPMRWRNGQASWTMGGRRGERETWDHAELAEDGE